MGRLARRAAKGKLKKGAGAANPAEAGAPPIDVAAADDNGDIYPDGPTGGQAETSIAVDSTGQHIVVGINDTRGFGLNPISVSGFIYSDDGGATWVDGGQLPVTQPISNIVATSFPQVFGDPEVKYLGGSTFVYFSIIVKKFSATGTAQTMGVHRSTDFGHTWQGPFEIPSATNPNGALSGTSALDAADKEFVDVDPDTGRALMTWSNFTSAAFAAGGVEISSTFSNDLAVATPPTWSARTVIAETAADGQMSIPRFAGNGSQNAYVAWGPDGNRSFLLAQQDPAGSWDISDSQMTAYVVLGLASIGGAAAEAAIGSAASFYILHSRTRCQQADGPATSFPVATAPRTSRWMARSCGLWRPSSAHRPASQCPSNRRSCRR